MYPLTSLYFEVSWGDQENTSSFAEVSGLTMEAEVVEYRNGNDLANSTSKQPGLRKFGNITLKRGIIPSEQANGLFEWYKATGSGEGDRRTITITLLNEERDPAMVWKALRAWPAKVEGPGLNSTGNEVAMETVEFVHEGLEVSAN